MSDYALVRPGFAVSQQVLETIARTAAERVDGVHVLDGRRLRRDRTVTVAEDRVSASLEVSIRYGVPLGEAAEQSRRQVAAALSQATGLEVGGVDVVVASVA